MKMFFFCQFRGNFTVRFNMRSPRNSRSPKYYSNHQGRERVLTRTPENERPEAMTKLGVAIKSKPRQASILQALWCAVVYACVCGVKVMRYVLYLRFLEKYGTKALIKVLVFCMVLSILLGVMLYSFSKFYFLLLAEQLAELEQALWSCKSEIKALGNLLQIYSEESAENALLSHVLDNLRGHKRKIKLD